MKKYIETIRQKPPHERRMHAMQLSGIIMAIVFVGWIATLGVRLASQSPATAQNGAAAGQTAGVVEAAQGGATLMVATSTSR